MKKFPVPTVDDFRAAELVDLRSDQVDFARAMRAVRRAKRGSPSTHPILGDEVTSRLA